MPRPRSIITFEGCYLGAWLLGLVNLALTWNSRMAMAAGAAGATLGPGAVTNVAYAGVIVTALITLALWWFAARRASVVAKWIVVVFFALGLLGFLSGMARGMVPGGIGGLLTIIAWVLQAVAVAMLFRADAKAWFASPHAVDPMR